MTVQLYKRERSPYWWAKISKLDGNGKVLDYERKSTKRSVKAEALLVAKKFAKDSLDVDQLGLKAVSTIGEVAERYINELRAAGKPSVKDAEIFLKSLESSNSRACISRMDRTFFNTIKNTLLDKKYSANYINNHITFWVSVYTKAKLDYSLKVAEVDTRNLKLKSKQKTRYLLDGEEEMLLAELDPTREIKGCASYATRDAQTHRKLQDQYDLVVFLLDTGARYSEVAEVPWVAVDRVDWKYVNLYREKVGNEGNLPMTNRLREILERRARDTNSPYVFASLDDPTKPRGYATKGIRNAIKRAGLNADHLVKRYGKFTPHSLRHTFASRLVQGGLSLYAVSKLLGHSSETMTKRYAFLSPSMVADKAADILNGRCV